MKHKFSLATIICFIVLNSYFVSGSMNSNNSKKESKNNKQIYTNEMNTKVKITNYLFKKLNFKTILFFIKK